MNDDNVRLIKVKSAGLHPRPEGRGFTPWQINMKVKDLGHVDYASTWHLMKDFTLNRQSDTEDELWILEHPPVYTQGQAGKPEHVLNANNIPLIQSDRGGQVTYHGPGQLVGYVLIDLNRKNQSIRNLVCQLENILIKTLAHFHIQGERLEGAPGVYVKGKKIASIGLRVKNGRTYHGIALNVDMDLNPFLGINPCGFKNMSMTQMRDFNEKISFNEVKQVFSDVFLNVIEQKPIMRWNS